MCEDLETFDVAEEDRLLIPRHPSIRDDVQTDLMYD